MKTQKTQEELNSIAYDDVMEERGPTNKDNTYYMIRYQFWYSLTDNGKRDAIDMEQPL